MGRKRKIIKLENNADEINWAKSYCQKLQPEIISPSVATLRGLSDPGAIEKFMNSAKCEANIRRKFASALNSYRARTNNTKQYKTFKLTPEAIKALSSMSRYKMSENLSEIIVNFSTQVKEAVAVQRRRSKKQERVTNEHDLEKINRGSRELINKNKDLEAEIKQLKDEVLDLESINQTYYEIIINDIPDKINQALSKGSDSKELDEKSNDSIVQGKQLQLQPESNTVPIDLDVKKTTIEANSKQSTSESNDNSSINSQSEASQSKSAEIGIKYEGNSTEVVEKAPLTSELGETTIIEGASDFRVESGGILELEQVKSDDKNTEQLHCSNETTQLTAVNTTTEEITPSCQGGLNNAIYLVHKESGYKIQTPPKEDTDKTALGVKTDYNSKNKVFVYHDTSFYNGEIISKTQGEQGNLAEITEPNDPLIKTGHENNRASHLYADSAKENHQGQEEQSLPDEVTESTNKQSTNANIQIASNHHEDADDLLASEYGKNSHHTPGIRSLHRKPRSQPSNK